VIIVFGSRKTKPKDEIRLEKQYSVKSWLFSKGITFDETVVPPEVPRPYEAVMAARLASRLYLDPANKGEERQRSDAETYFNGLDILREHTKDSKTREYIWQFEQIVKNHDILLHSIASNDVEGIILDFIDLHEIDMIAMHVYHRNFFEKLFKISLSKKLAFHVNVPILAIHE